MATTTRTMTIDEVPPARRYCEHPEHNASERCPSVAFLCKLDSKSRALREGLYVCEEHAVLNAKFIFTHIVSED